MGQEPSFPTIPLPTCQAVTMWMTMQILATENPVGGILQQQEVQGQGHRLAETRLLLKPGL